MPDFHDLEEALKKGEIVVLERGEGGTIKFRGSHKTDTDVALGWNIHCPADARAAPPRVIVKNYDLVDVPYQL